MHGRVIVALTGMLLLAAGCEMPLSPHAQGQLNAGYQSYQSGDNVATVSQMDAFLHENSRATRADEARFLRGLAQYNLKQYDRAKADLEQVVAHTKDPELRARASMALASLSYDTGDLAMAQNMYRHALDNLPPNHEKRAEAYYRLGCVLQRQGRWSQADQEFHKLVYYFPNSEPAQRAGRLINSTAWTVQAGSFSKMQYAKAAAAKLQAQGLAARTAPVMTPKGLLYVVQVGRYSKFEQAAKIVAQVRQIQPDAFIVATH